jgi:hypothetical protein
MRAVCCVVLGLFALTPSKAQTSQPCCSAGHIDGGVGTAAAVGIVAAAVGAGVAVTYLVLHDRGIQGCVVEADGKKTFVDSNKKVYSVVDGGPSLPLGEHVKVLGHTSGPKAAPTIKIEKIKEVYGPCKP